MSTYAARTILMVMKDARQRLNDNSVDIYGDSDADPTMLNLLSFVSDAYDDIEMQYAARDIDLLEKVVSTFAYVANATTISVPGGITDLHEPLEIFQRLNSADPWVEVPRKTAQGAPPTLAPQFLWSWEWSENSIKVKPATSSLELLVRYRRLRPYETAAAFVDFENIYWPLVWMTAYKASIPTLRASSIAAIKAEADHKLEQSILVESRRLQADVGSFGRWSGDDSGVQFFKR